MSRFLKTIGIFSLFVGVAYFVMIAVCGRFFPGLIKPNILYQLGGYGHLYTRLKEADSTTGRLDVLFLGSSHSYRGIDPRKFDGLKTFNLGSSSQTPLQTEVLLNRYLDKMNPKMIVYEVFPGALALDGVESSIDLISNGPNDLSSFKMAVKVNHIKVYNTFFYALARDFAHLNYAYKEARQKDGDTYIPGGYVQRDVQYFRHLQYPAKKAWKLDAYQLKEFEGILAGIAKRNIKLVLVYAPITPALYNSYSNNDYIDSLMARYSHGRYYNFNKLMKLDDSLHFYNADHLNQLGVEMFSAKLQEVIRKS